MMVRWTYVSGLILTMFLYWGCGVDFPNPGDDKSSDSKVTHKTDGTTTQVAGTQKDAEDTETDTTLELSGSTDTESETSLNNCIDDDSCEIAGLENDTAAGTSEENADDGVDEDDLQESTASDTSDAVELASTSSSTDADTLASKAETATAESSDDDDDSLVADDATSDATSDDTSDGETDTETVDPEETETETDTEEETQGDATEGASRYNRSCAACHGADGAGVSRAVLSECDECSSFDVLEAYIEAQMPPSSASSCTGDCAADTAAYILREFN